jgi:hypothetical protein
MWHPRMRSASRRHRLIDKTLFPFGRALAQAAAIAHRSEDEIGERVADQKRPG